MNQEQLDALLAQIGGGALSHAPAADTKKIPNPASKDNGGTSWTAPPEISVTIQRWHDPRSGRVVEAYQNADQSWTVVRNTTDKSLVNVGGDPATATASPASAAAGATVHTEGTPTGRTLPDGTPERDNERPVKVVRDKNGNQVGLAVPLEGKDLQDWHDDRERSRNPGRLTDAQVKAETERNRPGAPTLKPDGKGGTVAVQTMPDGTIKTTPLPGVPSDAAAVYGDVKQDPKTGAWSGLTKDGQWVPISGGPGLAPEKPTIRQGQEGRPDVQYVPDKNNPGQVIAVPIQGTGTSTAALPEGFARPQFSPMQVSSVLGQTQAKLDTWVQQATDENDRRARMQRATELMAEAHKEATTYINEQQIGTTTARDVYGNQISERGQTIGRQNQLTSSGAGMANQAVGTLLPLLRYAQAGSGDAAKALQQLMGMMQESVGAMGGLGAAPANIAVPGILGPYLGAAAAPGVAPGVAPAAVAPGAAPVAPGGPSAPALSAAAAAQRPWTDPNTGPSVIAPGAPGTAPVPDAAAAAQMAAQQQAAAQAAAAAQTTAQPAPAAPAPPVRDDWRTNPGPGAPPASSPQSAPGYGDPGFHRPDMQGPDTTDPGYYRPDTQGPATGDPGFYRPDMQGMQGGMPPLAIMQALLDRVEPMMQADPNWGVNDLAEIQLGRSPWG